MQTLAGFAEHLLPTRPIGGEIFPRSEDMEMRVKDQIIAEGVDGGDGSEISVGETEADAEDFLEGYQRR